MGRGQKGAKERGGGGGRRLCPGEGDGGIREENTGHDKERAEVWGEGISQN